MSVSARQMLEQMRAEQQRQEQPTARQMLEQLRAAQGANVTPFPVPPAVPRDSAPSFGPPMANVAAIPTMLGMTDPVSPEYRAAAAKGVDIDTGAPDIDRASMSLAPNQAYEADFAKNLLKRRFGTDVQVRIGPDSKDIEFLHPRSNRWTTIDERGLSKADLKDMLGPGMVLAPAVAGGALGAPAGAVGAAAGAGTGVFLGEGARLIYGRRKGVHNLPDEQIATEALKAAGFEFATSLAAEKTLHLGQLLKKFFSGRGLPQGEAEKVLRDIEAAMEDIGAIRAGGGEGFNPTIPQMLGDEALQAELSSVTAADRNRRAAEVERDKGNQTALESYFNQTFQPDPSLREPVGAALEGQAQQRTAQLRSEAESRLTADQERIRREVTGSTPSMDAAGAGSAIRDIAQARLDKLQGIKQAAWKEYDAAIGLNPQTSLSRYSVPITGEAAASINSLSQELKNAIFGLEKRRIQRVLPKELLAAAEKGGSFDLAVLDRSIKSLRSLKRAADSGFSPDLDSRAIMRVEDALKTARADFLRVNDPAALEALERAEAATVAKANYEQNSALSDILQREKGSTVYRLADNGKVFSRIIVANDLEAAAALREAAGSDPAKLHALKQGLWMVYRANFTDAGLPSLKLHQKFLDQYGDMAKVFFSKGEWDQIQRFGEFSKVLESGAKQVDDFVRRLSTGLSAKVESGRAEDAIKMLLQGKLNSRDARWLSSQFRNGGYMQDAMKVFGSEIRDTIMRDGKFNLNALTNLLDKRGGQIAEFAGQDYVKNLRVLRAGLERAQKVSAVSRTTPETAFIRWTKVVFRPLSREGLLRTAVRGEADSRATRVMYEILTDPQKLKEFVAIGQRRITDRRVAQFFASVGAASYLSDREISQ